MYGRKETAYIVPERGKQLGVMQGLRYLEDQREKQESRQTTPGLWKLWLKEGDRANFWFMNDGDDILVPFIHTVPKKRKNGSPWRKDVFCARTGYDDDTQCDLCDDDELGDDGKKAIKGPWSRLVCYVYVTKIQHAQDKPDANPRWERLTQNGKTVYIEHVNGPRLLIAKPNLSQQIFDYFVGDPDDDTMINREPTLLDREYQLVRTGKGNASQETLKSRAPSEMPDEVKEAIAAIEPLEAAVTKEFTDIAPRRDSGPQERTYGDQGYDPNRIPSASDFNDGDDELQDVDF